MITGLLIVYLILYIKSRISVSRIKNQGEVWGEVNGFEKRVIGKKSKMYDIVSFMVDNDMFLAKKSSSPFYLSNNTMRQKRKYKIIYNKLNPSDNIIIDNLVFEQIRKSIYVFCSFYVILIIASIWF